MSKDFILDTSGQNWRLPALTDPEDLRRQIESAMTDGEVIRVEVGTGDNPLKGTIHLLNCRVLETAAVVDLRADV